MKDFITEIKKYSTENIILLFARYSQEIYKKRQENKNYSSYIEFPIEYRQYSFGPKKQKTIMLFAWDIQHIQYLAIMNSNDHRRQTINNAQEAALLVNRYRVYSNENSNAEQLREMELSGVFKQLFGMGAEQFIYQDISWVFQRFNRNYHILFGSPNINKIMDIDAIVKNRIGLSAQELITTYFIVFWLCLQNPNILSAPETLYKKKDKTILTSENIKKIVDYYTISYDEVRKSPLENQVFFSKPFIKTQKGITLMTNFYLVLMLMADGVFWIIRDYYRERNSQDFVRTFGEMFEVYFEELTSMYLDSRQYQKLSSINKSTADFVLFFNNAIILIELKSALIGIQAKQANPNVEQIDGFFKRHIEKAYTQLRESEKNYIGERPVLKFILLYENIINTAMIQAAAMDIFQNDSNVYITTIAIIENFLVLYSNDKNKAEAILEVLVAQNDNTTNLQAELDKIEVSNNSHSLDRLNYFDKFMKKLERELV